MNVLDIVALVMALWAASTVVSVFLMSLAWHVTVDVLLPFLERLAERLHRHTGEQ